MPHGFCPDARVTGVPPPLEDEEAELVLDALDTLEDVEVLEDELALDALDAPEDVEALEDELALVEEDAAGVEPPPPEPALLPVAPSVPEDVTLAALTLDPPSPPDPAAAVPLAPVRRIVELCAHANGASTRAAIVTQRELVLMTPPFVTVPCAPQLRWARFVRPSDEPPKTRFGSRMSSRTSHGRPAGRAAFSAIALPAVRPWIWPTLDAVRPLLGRPPECFDSITSKRTLARPSSAPRSSSSGAGSRAASQRCASREPASPSR
jgi:hypothetical protein